MKELEKNSKALKTMAKDIETNKRKAEEKRRKEERLADKRRRGAPKKEAKAKVKAAIKVSMEKLEKTEVQTIGRKTLKLFNDRKGFMDKFKKEKKLKLEDKKNFGL